MECYVPQYNTAVRLREDSYVYIYAHHQFTNMMLWKNYTPNYSQRVPRVYDNRSGEDVGVEMCHFSTN